MSANIALVMLWLGEWASTVSHRAFSGTTAEIPLSEAYSQKLIYKMLPVIFFALLKYEYRLIKSAYILSRNLALSSR